MTVAAARPDMKKLALAAASVMLLAVACGGGGGERSVTGIVLEAVARDLVEIELLRVRDADGRVWEFTTEGNVGISAAHLRQHQVLGERVLVTYREEDGNLIATDVSDAPAPGS